MKVKRFNGVLLDRMLKNGLANLCLKEEELNSLNVFPVADGDTGTNMRLTLESGLKVAKPVSELNVYLKKLSDGMLMGARGNSGVILSQLFRGMYLSLKRYPSASAAEFRNALIMAHRTAYSTVVRPVEGTILTVAREGIEHIRGEIGRSTYVETLFSSYIGEMKKSLAMTPELLPELKSAGVVDSGALGYITIFEGMLAYLFGEKIKAGTKKKSTAPSASDIDLSVFNGDTEFKDGYCVEFIIQLMKSAEYNTNFSIDRYISELKVYGNSIVAVENEGRVKVHVHTHKPGKVMSLSQEYGEFLTVKVENMQVQHNERDKKLEEKLERTAFAVVGVADTPKIKKLYKELGCRYVIEGGTKMNTSVEDFIHAFTIANADTIVVLPNNKNLLQTAGQAKKFFSGSDIRIIETTTIPQGYCALGMDVSDNLDYDFRIRQITSGKENTVSIFAATASKDYVGEVSCKSGDAIGLIEDEVVFASESYVDSFMGALSKVSDIDDRECLIIFKGINVSSEKETELTERINETYPMMDVSFLEGGSAVYAFMAALS